MPESEFQDREMVPVVRNGAHAEWNLMVAHLKCNQSRGVKQILPFETKEEAVRYIADHVALVAQREAA